MVDRGIQERETIHLTPTRALGSYIVLNTGTRAINPLVYTDAVNYSTLLYIRERVVGQCYYGVFVS